jgi:hypothetical protein
LFPYGLIANPFAEWGDGYGIRPGVAG